MRFSSAVGEVEVVRREDLSLDDGEVDLDLVEPTGVDRRVDDDQVGPLTNEAALAALAAMRASVIDHPEHPGSGAIGFSGPDLLNQPAEGSDASLGFTAAEDAGPLDVPRGQVGPGALAHVLVLDTHRLSGLRCQAAMLAVARLNAGPLVGHR